MSQPRPNNAIALLCTLHPSSSKARDQILSLLSRGREYYSSPRAQCTTWSYFVPSTRPKAPSQLIPKSKHDTTIVGVEIYSAKEALSTQQLEPWFKEFEKTMQERQLRERKDELTAWYPTAGFVARDEMAIPFGKGTIVMIAVFTCTDGGRDKVVDVIAKYTDYVKANEQDVLTYCTMTRPKAPKEVLLFERYRDHKALAAHGSTKEFKAIKGIAPHIEVKATKLQEFMELDDAFVGNVVGVAEKLAAKL